MNPLNILFQCSFASSILLLLLLFSLSTSTSTSTTLTFDDCKSLTDNEEEVTYLPDSSSSNSSLTTKILTIESEIIAAKFAYLMKLCVKTSRGKGGYETTYAIPDTGSDFIWLNSEDCRGKSCHCDTTTSSTAAPPLGGKCIKEDKNLLIKCDDDNYCDEKKWKDLKIPIKCPSRTSHYECKYEIDYFDHSSTEGLLGMGNFKFVVQGQNPSPYYDEFIMFGVSIKSEGPLEKESKGVVGLGLGSSSLIKQFNLVPKFSYCLQHPESKAKRKFSFGSAVKTDGKITDLLSKHEVGDICEFRYCVHLSTISFNGGRHHDNEITVNEKNKVMVVDSGTTFTSLANGLFDEFFEKVKLAIGGDNKPIKINDHYNICFVEESAKKLDKVTFGFGVGESKIDVELKRENFLDEVTHDDGHGGGKRKYLCLTVENADGHNILGSKSSKKNNNILGSRAQMDFLVAFDTTAKRTGGMKVSFQKDCGGNQINNGGGEFEALL